MEAEMEQGKAPEAVLHDLGIDPEVWRGMVKQAQEEIARTRSLKGNLLRDALQSRQTKETSQ
jgi:hypothetical protein